MTDEPDTAELENRIEKLEATIEKMLPGRRDALKMGGAALVGGAVISGTAAAADETNQVGTIGDSSNNVDIFVESIAFSDQNKLRTIEVDGTDADGRINFKTS